MSDPRRDIPGVDQLLGSDAIRRLTLDHPRALVVDAVRSVLEDVRAQLAAGRDGGAPGAGELAARVRERLEAASRASLKRVVNATGVALHTNLGRAPLAEAARAAVGKIAAGYSNLEYDLEAGGRGQRGSHLEGLLREITGADGALVVNNNAAAVVLALNELGDGRQVIVSRGELVEIGGSFRVPEIMAKSGARIVEVGATNRTHPRDYEDAIGADTAAILKVHRSNFRQSGFVAEVDLPAVAEIAERHGLPVIHDLGSGLPYDTEGLGLPPEPSAAGSLAAGAHIVTFSADKLLGGPQAGIVAGRGDLIERMRRNPFLRAFRVGKLTLAALEATLQLWRDPGLAGERIPVVEMLARGESDLERRAQRLASALRGRAPADVDIAVERDVAEVGGGSCPGVELPAWTIRVSRPGRSEASIEALCRTGEPPVIGRVRKGAFCLDLRTVGRDEEDDLIRVVAEALERVEEPSKGRESIDV